MKDYTEIFSKAKELSEGYDCKKMSQILCLIENIYCGDYDEWGYRNWNEICRKDGNNLFAETYGYISKYYPVALLKGNCPEYIKAVLAENNILFTELSEPMSCDENILREYVDHMKVFDENFVDNCDYSYDDERFEMLMYRLEKGYKCYIDSSYFMFDEIKED